MRDFRIYAAVVLALGAGTARADDALSARTPTDVANHHISAMLKHDVPALLEDYAADAVVVNPTNVYFGPLLTKKLFVATGRKVQLASDEKFWVASVNGDVVIEDWSHVTHGVILTGSDVMVVRQGRIVFQASVPSSAAVDSSPARSKPN